MAHSVIMSHLIRIYIVILFGFLTETPIWNNGSDQIWRWKSPLQKFRDVASVAQLAGARLETKRSRVRLPPKSATFFNGDGS